MPSSGSTIQRPLGTVTMFPPPRRRNPMVGNRREDRWITRSHAPSTRVTGSRRPFEPDRVPAGEPRSRSPPPPRGRGDSWRGSWAQRHATRRRRIASKKSRAGAPRPPGLLRRLARRGARPDALSEWSSSSSNASAGRGHALLGGSPLLHGSTRARSACSRRKELQPSFNRAPPSRIGHRLLVAGQVRR